MMNFIKDRNMQRDGMRDLYTKIIIKKEKTDAPIKSALCCKTYEGQLYLPPLSQQTRKIIRGTSNTLIENKMKLQGPLVRASNQNNIALEEPLSTISTS